MLNRAYCTQSSQTHTGQGLKGKTPALQSMFFALYLYFFVFWGFLMDTFNNLRHNAHLSRAACADYFKVNLSTVNRWDNAVICAPFAVCELLRVIAGGLPALSLRSGFSGWSFGGEFIYSPEGEKFLPEDIKMIRIMHAQAAAYRSEIIELEKALYDKKERGQPDNVISFSKYARS